jgi:MoaA/NifB/PqqE/SkfB family radical SAM enzyme
MYNLYEKIRKLKTIFLHPSVGRNVNVLRLIRNGIPYYLRRDGWAENPLNVYFIVNNICNLRCKMCDIGSMKADGAFAQNLGYNKENLLTTEKIKEIIDEISVFKPSVGFTSTEPLLRKDILEIARYVIEKKLELLITTNGYLLEKFAESLVDLNLTRLSVSLDGPPDVHNRIRGKDDVFQKATTGLKLVDEIKKKRGKDNPKTFVTFTITNYNYDKLYDFMCSIDDIGVEQVNFQLSYFVTKDMAEIHNRTWANKYPVTETCIGEGIDPLKVDVEVLFDQIQRVQKAYPDKSVFLFDIDKAKLKTYFYDHLRFINKLNCVFPWFIAQVSPTCELLGLTRCYPVSLGDLKNQSFKQAWNGKQMRAFRMDLQKHGRFTACCRCEGVLYR